MCYLYMEISCYLGEIMLSGAVLVGFLIGDLGHYLISLRSGLLDEIKKCKIVCSIHVCMVSLLFDYQILKVCALA